MERNNGIDFLRGLAIIHIAWVHSYFYTFSSIDLNFFGNTVGRYTVPFFFASSGYLLYAKLQSAHDKKKYIFNFVGRALRIFLFFTALCFLMDLFFYIVRVREQIFYFDPISWNALLFVFWGVFSISSVPLWFVLALALSVLMLHLAHKYKLNTTALLVISLILNVMGLFAFWQPYSVFFTIIPFFPRMALFFGLFYLTLGYYIGENYDLIKSKTKQINYLAFTLISLIALVVERALFLIYYEVSYGEFFLSNIPLAFFLMMFLIEKSDFFKESFMTKIGRNVLGIYVFHIFLVTIFKNCILLVFKPSDTYMTDLLSLLITIPNIYLSYRGYLLLEKITFYKKYIYGEKVNV